MKKKIILVLIILIELMTATIKIDNVDRKHIHLNNIVDKVEETVEEIVNNFEVQPEPSVEIVDEYVYAMEGFIC